MENLAGIWRHLSKAEKATLLRIVNQDRGGEGLTMATLPFMSASETYGILRITSAMDFWDPKLHDELRRAEYARAFPDSVQLRDRMIDQADRMRQGLLRWFEPHPFDALKGMKFYD